MAQFHRLTGIRIDPDPPTPTPVFDQLGNVIDTIPNPLPTKTPAELGSLTKSPEQPPLKGKR